VRKAYDKNGFDVTIQPSIVNVLAKPRGWYRTLRRRLQPNRKTPEPEPHALGRKFDVVHCLSGGFLSLYVLRRSRVALTFQTLLLDSTPILPKPAAFTRFTRAYLQSAGFSLPLRVFPRKLHQWLVKTNWLIALLYVQLRHRFLRAIGRLQGKDLDEWTSGPVDWAVRNDYGRVAKHAMGSVLEGAAEDARLVFMYNPDDPYLDVADVREAANLAASVGARVDTVVTDCDHVQAMFKMPSKVFNILNELPVQPAESSAVSTSSGTYSAISADRVAELVREGH